MITAYLTLTTPETIYTVSLYITNAMKYYIDIKMRINTSNW